MPKTVTVDVDLDRPMSVEEFAAWIGVEPVWVRRRLSVLPGVIRHSRKIVRIIPRFYSELPASPRTKARR